MTSAATSLAMLRLLRAQDVSPQNVVESYRVADATLQHNSPGPLGETKSGIFTRILGIFLP